MKTFRAALNELDNESDTALDHDVIFMKLPPPGFLRTKVEVVYNMWRFARAGIPVFVFDGDLMLDQANDWLRFGDDSLTAAVDEKINARTPYWPKKTRPNWHWRSYWYDVHDELPVTTPIGAPWAKPHNLGYVGNDWKQADSPRAAGLGKFYSWPKDTEMYSHAVWGRWTEENRKLSGLPPCAFRGPINAGHVRLMYQGCIASVILGLPQYYKVGLVTQRYREIIQSGCLALIDAAYPLDVTSRYISPEYRVEDAEQANEWCERLRDDHIGYRAHLMSQREYVRANDELKIENWMNELEHLAAGETGDVS